MGKPSLLVQPESESRGGRPQRAASILDILGAVKAVAPSAPEIDVWWLASRSRMNVGAEQPSRRAVEFVVEGQPLAAQAHDRLTEALSRSLGGAPVTVRFARSPGDTRALFRLLTLRRSS